MVDVIRRHGLIAFMAAVAVVSLFQSVAAWGSGHYAGPAGAALLMAAILVEELERREMVPDSVYLQALRWCGVLGALGFLIRE